MRLFIALDLNEEIRNYLFEIENELRKVLKAKISWIAKSKIHITLKFIGEIKEEKINEIKKRLAGIYFNKFSLELNNIGFFPNEEKPRVVPIIEGKNNIQRNVEALRETRDVIYEQIKNGESLNIEISAKGTGFCVSRSNTMPCA